MQEYNDIELKKHYNQINKCYLRTENYRCTKCGYFIIYHKENQKEIDVRCPNCKLRLGKG